MQKRILSLLLVACMLLTVVPVMAFSAFAAEPTIGTEAVTTTFERGGENWPTYNLPAATDSTLLVWDGYSLDGTAFDNSVIATPTYNGGWSFGAKPVTYANGVVTVGNGYSAYPGLRRPTGSETKLYDIALTDSNGTWGSNSSGLGGGIFFNGDLNNCITAPINYGGDGDRTFKSYTATSAIQYEVAYTGIITIDLTAGFHAYNGCYMLILHNGKELTRLENDNTPEMCYYYYSQESGYTKGDIAAAKTFDDFVVDLAVNQGDIIEFVSVGEPLYTQDKAEQMGVLNSHFDYQKTKRGFINFSASITYAAGWSFIDYDALYYQSQWNQGSADCLTVSGNCGAASLNNRIERFYKWYKADGTAHAMENTKEPLQDDSYAIINPKLYELGIITDAMSWDEMWGAYGEYMSSMAVLTYTGDWTMGNIVDGEYLEIGQRAYMYGYSPYGLRKSSGGPIAAAMWDVQFAAPRVNVQRYIDEMVDLGKTSDVQPDADGKIYFSQIVSIYDEPANKVSTYNWGDPDSGGVYCSTGVYAIRPGNTGKTALTFTVPDGVYGTATIDLEDQVVFLNNENDAWFTVMYNGKSVWPANAMFEDTSTWYALNDSTKGSVTAELKALPLDVKPGDTIQLCFARGAGEVKKVSVDIKPNIIIEKKCAVEFTDAYGDLLWSTVVPMGANMPALPIRTEGGFFINGSDTSVSELPATVTDHIFIQYADDVVISSIEVDKANISIDDDFSVNLYLKADPMAVSVGATVYRENYDDAEVSGVKQADGTFKISLSGVAAKDLSAEMEIWLYQEFNGGYEYSADDPEYVKATDILTTYTTDAEYAKYKDIAAAALDYAAAAEAYFYGEDLAADVVDRLAAQDAAIAELSKEFEVENEYEDYSISGATLVLKDQIAFKVQISLTDVDVLDDDVLDFSVQVNDENGREVGIFEVANFQIGEVYEFNGSPLFAVSLLNSVAPTDYDAFFQFTVIDDDYDEASGTWSYSVNTYIARTFDGGAGESDNLLRAIYAFGVAAEAL